MSKIFEALQNAQEEGTRLDSARVLYADDDRGSPSPQDRAKGLESFAEAPAAILSSVRLPATLPALDMEEEMICLHQRLDALLPDAAKQVVQFIASRPGEGTSTIAREFAWVSATRFGRLALLLDSGPGPRDVRDDHPLEDLTSQVGRSNLYTAPLPAASAAVTGNGDGARSDAFWEALRRRYQRIVVDSPPATTSADGLAMCAKVDGVVLVVEAEGTRWPVAQSVKDAIVRSGGKVFGVVLNKRRFYIPSFIYRRF
jgi:Mrp family chromosome partitioning ATPase